VSAPKAGGGSTSRVCPDKSWPLPSSSSSRTPWVLPSPTNSRPHRDRSGKHLLIATAAVLTATPEQSSTSLSASGGPCSQWQGPPQVAEALRSWFGEADDFELVDATVGEIGGRLHLSWRIRVRPAPFGIGEGWHVIEQHGYADATDSI